MKTFDGYKKQALTDVYALLAGGGHKPLSEFSMAHTHPYLPLSGGTITGNIILKGGTSTDMTYAGNIHPYIRFDNSDSSQNISLIFTDYDSYRRPAGIKLVGNQGNEWFEAANIYATTFYGALSGNASSATKLQTSRNLWGNSFNGTADISGTIKFNNVTSGLCEGIQWTCGDNDFARIKAGATGSNAGYLEIATADDGNEPIYVRQYSGVFNSVVRTLTLLDSNGFSHFPSYINIGGNENNNSSPDRVWGSNGSDSYLRSYRTSALRVAYASNSDTVDGYHATSGRTFNGNINWSENWNDAWSDGTNKHPWYGFDHRYPNTGAYSTTISDFFGMTIKTANTLRLDFGTLLLNGTNIYNINVASATKLQTPRTIWGQNFDGTTNIDNTLRIRQTTGNYCEGIRIQTADGAWSTIILGATADSGTNTNAWSIHRKADNNFAISRNSSDGINGLVMTSVGMGLGTTAPTHRLDVRGDTKITGSIRDLAIGGGIYWNPYVESTTDNSDSASITVVKSGVVGGTTLVLSQMNDTSDTIQFKTNTAARLYHNSYPILTTQNTYVSNNKGYINDVEITQVNNASSATTATKLASSGYANNALSYYQTDQAFDGSATGWAHYIIANHHDGASYYHYTIRLPFWNVPQYRRQTGNTSNVTSWYNFITAENISSQSVNYATSAGNADTVDGLHVHSSRNNEANKIVRTDGSGYIQAGWINTTSGDMGTTTINKIYCSNDDYIRYKTPANFFPTLANSGNNISITVAGQNRTLTIGYATNADTVDKYHANTIYNAPSFTVNNSNTSNTYILLATITISGTSLSCAEFTTLFQNRECLDSSSFILSGAIRRNSTTSVTATLSYITLHTKTPRNIYLRSDDGITFRVYIQSAVSTYTTYYRAIPIVDSRNITYSNTGTTSPISGSVLNITATKGGNVNYANSAGNADTLDGNHASAFALVGHTHNYDNVYSKLGHTHDDRYYTESEINSKLGAYLPLSGGTMTGSIYIPGQSATIIHTTKSSSNWVYISELFTGSSKSETNYQAGIGWHNTGGNGNGALTLVPYAQNSEPWLGNVGLYIAQNSLKFNGTAISLAGHAHSWSSITNKPCTLISYSRDSKNIDANNWRVKECSLIEIRGTELTYSNLAMNGYNSFFNFWTPNGYVCTQFQIGDGAFYYRSKQSASATITTNWYRVMDSNNCSVSKSGETLNVKINGTNQSLTNTWRGIQDNLTSSTNTTQSLSAKQGYLLANGYARDNTKLPLSGGTMTGVIKSTFKSSTWINGVTNAIVKGEYTDYGAILSMPVKNGRVSISSYPSSDNYIYFGYATSAQISANTNSFNKKMYWDAANNKLVADTFQGALQGNASTATALTTSAGSASLPIYFSGGKPVACTKSSIFSNLSNNGNNISITIAGQTRTLTVGYASEAGWASEAYSAEEADLAISAGYAEEAGNADTLDGYHASSFSTTSHTHTLRLESTTETNSITLAHGGKYKLTAGGNSVIFTLPTDTASIAFSGGLISSSGNTLTQANHSITIGGQTVTAGYSNCNIINNLSINSLSSSSTTNLTAQIAVNGITSTQKTITQLHSRFWDVTSNSATSNISPGNYSATITEVQGNASGITGNQPTTSWYHVYTAVGHNTKYATQLALGMTTDGIWYRKYYNSSWGSWLTVLHSGNIGNYYWANISISSTKNTNTTPQFGKVKINTASSTYQLNVSGDSYVTGWSRAKNGFYCEGNGVYFTHNGTKGEISVKNNNEFCWGSNSDTLYFNYAAPSQGTTVTKYIWNAGSSSSYASHTMGDITLGSNSNNNYQLKRAGSLSDWYNGRDKAIIRQTSAANGYSVVISSKTTNGSWEIGNESNDLMFTYITDSNYNSKNDDFLGLLYITSEGEVHSNNNIYATHFYENSDIRYKKILKNLSINSNIIANLPLFDFEWIENNIIGTGTSAQAVQQILPNLVSGTDRLTLDYGVLGTIAGITACKELVMQKSELQQLKEKVKQLEDKLRKYENT